MRKLLILCTLLVLFSGIGFCLADESRPVEQSAGQAQPGRAASGVDTGDTSWVLISTALVLLMTPGLAFFYGGMVGRKNILGMLMQCFWLQPILRPWKQLLGRFRMGRVEGCGL